MWRGFVIGFAAAAVVALGPIVVLDWPKTDALVIAWCAVTSWTLLYVALSYGERRWGR